MEALQLVPRSRSDLRVLMREATAEPHARLDAMFEPMFATDDLDLYGRFLAMNQACLRAIDPLLAASPLRALVPEIAAPSRLRCLDLDMADLHLRPIDMPPLEMDAGSVPAAFGAAYVIEGSRLGSTLLHRRLGEWAARRPGRAVPARYLADSAGAGCFPRLMQRASELDWTAGALDEAAGAARHTFERFLLAASHTGPGA